MLQVDRFSHLASKHAEALWSQNNHNQIQTALIRSCETHIITLRVDGKDYIYSPFSNKFFNSVPIYLKSFRKIDKHERPTAWKLALEQLLLPTPTAPSLPTPPPCRCLEWKLVLDALEKTKTVWTAGGEANLKIINATVEDGKHSGTEDCGVGEDEAGAGEDD
jgi:hypothetical protein